MSKSIFSVTGLKQTLVSGYGEGLTDKQKKALSFALEPGISDSQNAGGAVTEDIDTVYGGADADNAAPLSLKTTTSLCISTGLGNHVSLADGVLGQVKRIIHLTSTGPNLVITPTNFAAGTNITSDLQKRSVTLLYDGDNWQVIAGEITGTAEFVIA
jgi:hypothetical protein